VQNKRVEKRPKGNSPDFIQGGSLDLVALSSRIPAFRPYYRPPFTLSIGDSIIRVFLASNLQTVLPLGYLDQRLVRIKSILFNFIVIGKR